MVQYNPKDWLLFIFRFHKSDTMRVLARIMFFLMLYTAAICYLEREVFKLNDTSPLKNLGILHTLLGMVISLLLVFRTNTAYDRWWEGRKLWGALVNNSRNLALKLDGFLPIEAKAERQFFLNIIPMYANALRTHLVNSSLANELFDVDGLQEFKQHIDVKKHVPNQVARLLIKHIQDARDKNLLTDTQLLLMNEELRSYTDICGACERIKNTPIPFSYSIFIKKFIFFYVVTLPFALSFSLSYYAIPITLFIFYVLASLELIAEEIEDPFGTDSNDLPMQKIAENIKKHVNELIRFV